MSALGLASAFGAGYLLHGTEPKRPLPMNQAERDSASLPTEEASPVLPPLRLPALPSAMPDPPVVLGEPEMDESGAAGEPLPDSPEAMQASLEATYETEVADRAWAPPAETTLSNRLAAVLPERSRLTSARCRESMCEVRIEHAESDGHHALTRLLGNERPWPAAIHITAPRAGADGRTESVVYIAREGRPLVGIAE